MKINKILAISVTVMIFCTNIFCTNICATTANTVIETCFDDESDLFNKAPAGWQMLKVGGDYSWCVSYATAGCEGGKTVGDKYFTMCIEGLTPQKVADAGFSATEYVSDPFIHYFGNASYPVMTYECSFLNGYDGGQYFAQNIWGSASDAQMVLRSSGGMLWYKGLANEPLARIKVGRWYKTAVTVYSNGRADIYLNGNLLKNNVELFSNPITEKIPRYKLFMYADKGTDQMGGRGRVSLDNIRWYGGDYADNCNSDRVEITSGSLEIDSVNKYIYLSGETDVNEVKKQLISEGTLEIYKDGNFYTKCTGKVTDGAVAVVKSKSGEVFEYYDFVVPKTETGNLNISRTNENSAASVSLKDITPEGTKLILAVYDGDKLSDISLSTAEEKSQVVIAKAESSADKTVKAFLCDFTDGFKVIKAETAQVQTKDEEVDSVLSNNAFSREILGESAAFNINSNYAWLGGERVVLENSAYENTKSEIMVPISEVCENFAKDWYKSGDKVVVNSVTLSAEIKNGEMFVAATELAEALDLPYKIYKNGLVMIGKSPAEKKLYTDVPARTDLWNLDEVGSYLIYDRPTPEVLLNLFNENSVGVHPRIRTNGENMERLKEEYKNGGIIKEYVDEWLLPQVDMLLKNGYHPVYGRKDGLRFAEGENMRDYVPKIALAYILTQNEAYKNLLWTSVEELCSFPDWNAGRHFLDVSQAAGAVAVAYDWLYSEWSREQRKIMATAIHEKAFSELQKVYDGNPGRWEGSVNPLWERVPGNWNGVCNGNMAQAAMAIMEEYPQECANLLSSMIHSLEYQLQCFLPDGGYKEGPSRYWNYMMIGLQPCLASLDETFKTDFGLTKAPGFKNTWKFPTAMTNNLGYSNNYSDTAGPITTNNTMGNYFWFAKKFDIPQLGSLRLKLLNEGRDRTGITVSDLLYYDSSFAETEAENLPLDFLFEGADVQAVSMRTDYTDNNGAYLAYHAVGELGHDHGHLDSGTYVLDMAGFRVAVDLGADDYNLPGMFSYETTRNKYYRIRPEGHNLFVINPDSTFFGQNFGVFDKVESLVSKPRGAISVANLDNAYAGKAGKARRGYMLTDDRQSIIVRDEITLSQAEGEVYSMIHTLGQVEIIDNNTVVVTGDNGKKVKIQFITNADSWEIKNMAAEPLPLSPKMAGQNANAGVSRITFIMQTKNKDLYSAVRYTPLDSYLSKIPFKNEKINDWEIPDGEIVPLLSEEEIADMTKYSLTLAGVSNVPQPENGPENTIDGDENTRWSADGRGDWIKYDLGAVKTISAVGISTWYSDIRQTILDIEVSKNGSDWIQVFSDKTPQKSGMAYFGLEDISARYIRITGYGNTGATSNVWTSITEVNVLGK